MDTGNQRDYFLPNFSNILVTKTDKELQQLQKCDVLSKFHQEQSRCRNFSIKKERVKGPPA